jgi:AraC-like DNA-binding protein
MSLSGNPKSGKGSPTVVALTDGRPVLSGPDAVRHPGHDQTTFRKYDRAVTYRERATPVVGAVLWQRKLGNAPGDTPIMPDGCLDLLWDGNRLFVAGPDTAARWHRSPAGTTYVAVRFSGGLGPTLLGVPADELRDRTANLEELWSGRQVRVLTEQVEANPAAVLEAWVVKRAARCDQDPLGPRVLAMAKAETPIAVMAERLCISPRQLHRRCIPTFGYGPRHLSRVMRFQRALEEVRCGVPLAQVAAASGYTDQAHLSREVRALASTTPRGLLGDPYPDGS